MLLGGKINKLRKRALTIRDKCDTRVGGVINIGNEGRKKDTNIHRAIHSGINTFREGLNT